MHREKTAMLWFDVEIKDKQNERESVCFCHYCVQNKGRWQKNESMPLFQRVN